MERLTGREENGHAYIIGCPDFEIQKTVGMIIQRVVDKCADIEDILGDDYDLDRLSVLVNQRMTMREDVAARMKLVGGIPLDRLRELVEAWKDGPCALCMYRPPSSTDGKPCTMCPASRGGELTWK